MKFRETAIVSGGLLIQQATVFATSILIARSLGPIAFGTLGTLKSLSGVLLIVTPLGLDVALLKHASFYHDRPRQLRTISRALRVLVAGLNLLLLALVAAWLGGVLQAIYAGIPNFSLLCLITMLGMIFATDVQVSGALYRVFDRIVTYSIIVNYSQPLLRLALSALVLLGDGGVTGIVWVNAAMFLYAFMALTFDGRRNRVKLLPMPVSLVARKARTVLSESLWMALSLLIYQAIRLVDILILAALTSTQIVGEYTAMSTVAQLIQIYPLAISQTLGPRIALFYKCHDMVAIVAELRAYLRRATLLGGYLFGGIAVFGADLDLVFGQNFSFSWPLALLLAFGWYVSAILAPFGFVLSMTGRHRQELVILSAGAALLVACLLVLIPAFQAIGAALSVAVVFVTVNAVRCVTVIRILHRNPLEFADLLPPAGFLMIALLCRETGTLLGARHLWTLILECAAYSALAGIGYFRLLASGAERQAIARIWTPRVRLS